MTVSVKVLASDSLAPPKSYRCESPFFLCTNTLTDPSGAIATGIIPAALRLAFSIVIPLKDARAEFLGSGNPRSHVIEVECFMKVWCGSVEVF